MGIASGYNTSTGVDNVFIGAGAGNSNGSGSFNTISGWAAGAFATVGVANYNSFYGYKSGAYNMNGSVNSYYGSLSGNQNSNNDNDSNAFMGHKSGYNNEGDANTFMGISTGLSNTTGKHNSFFGAYSGESSTDGDLNTYLGFRTRATTGLTVNNSTTIGSNAEVATDNTIIFGDNSVNVGIGLSGNPAGPLAKLHVLRNVSNSISWPTGIYIDNPDVDVAGTSMGIGVGLSNRTTGANLLNVGILSLAANADINIGCLFGSNVTATTANYGGYFGAAYAPTNLAVYGYAPDWNPPTTIFNVAIYGDAPQAFIPAGGFITGSGSWAGYFNGDVAITGFTPSPSDSTIKTKIKKFSKASSILNQINCYSFYFDSTKYGAHVNLPKTHQYGFIAQEVAKADSDFVQRGCLPPKIDSLGNIITKPQPVLMIDYKRMIPLLLGGYKEQQVIIDSLNSRLTLLETIVSNCCSQSMRNANPERTGINEPEKIKLENLSACILYQNQPNPYQNSTVIRFFIPENMNDVKITFQDNTGKTLKEVEIKQTGQGSLEVDGSDLSTGIYTYSLVVSGRIIDTKKMMKQ